MNRSLTTRERLLQAATEIFAREGYAGASVREICAHARANPGAVSYHFGGKQQLYRAVLRSALGLTLPSPAGDQPPERRLAELVHALADAFSNRPVLTRLLLRDVADGGEAAREALVPTLRRAVDWVALAAGGETDPAAAGAARERAAAILCAALALPLVWPLIRESASLSDDRYQAVLALLEGPLNDA